MYPDNLYYTKDHEWVKVEDDLAIIGITEFAQKQLGDIVYIELPEIGTNLEVHQTIGAIESVKAVSDVFSPIAGEVIEVNEKLNESPELINQDPYGQGWIIKLRIKNKTDLNQLMSASEYEKYVESLEA
ncbi:MAG: glycine cleavage system protein GcvH [Candidatus Aminicenantes bacterium]|nr:glycine cleavage system protein GcvH [Candidatus Aminicenantes bacterium]